MTDEIKARLDALVASRRAKPQKVKANKDNDIWTDAYLKYYPNHIKTEVARKDIIILESIIHKIDVETSVLGVDFFNWCLENWHDLSYKSSLPNIKEFNLSYKDKLVEYMKRKQPINRQGSLRVIKRNS